MTATTKRYDRDVHCSICGKTGRFAAHWPVGDICSRCYGAARRSPLPCQACGQSRVLVGIAEPPDSKALVTPTLCGPCSGAPQFAYLCDRCGGSEEPYTRGSCVRCAIKEMLRSEFGDIPSWSPAGALIDALEHSRRPRSVMQWLANPRGGARIVRELINSNTPITHQVLDRYDARETWSLKRTLVDLDVLPARSEHFERLDSILERVTAPMPPTQRNLLRSYASWRLFRRARRRYEASGRFTYSQLRVVWRRLEHVAAFLAWLSANGTALEDLNQPTLDRWLTTPDVRTATADFLRWASGRGLAPGLVVTHARPSEPTQSMSDDERWAQLKRCLFDNLLPDDVRAAGAILLLYGVPLTRVVELTSDHLHFDDGTRPSGFSIEPGGPAIIVPPALRQVLGRAPFQLPGPATPLVGGNPSAPRWLFPGRGPSGHMSDTGLRRRLAAHGLQVRSSRNAALIALAGEVPAPVLSDLFGMSTAAAIHWSRRAGRDWLGYINALESRQRPTTATVRRPI